MCIIWFLMPSPPGAFPSEDWGLCEAGFSLLHPSLPHAFPRVSLVTGATAFFFHITFKDSLCSHGTFLRPPHKMFSHVPFPSELARSLQHNQVEGVERVRQTGLHPNSAPYCMVQTKDHVPQPASKWDGDANPQGVGWGTVTSGSAQVRSSWDGDCFRFS